jgi:hypothetical protein
LQGSKAAAVPRRLCRTMAKRVAVVKMEAKFRLLINCLFNVAIHWRAVRYLFIFFCFEECF